MSFIGRSWRYVTRKRVKSLIVLAILTIMATVLLTANAITAATDQAAAEVESKTGSGFVLGNNAKHNMGTPRGAGTVKPGDIAKIAGLDGVEGYAARQNVTADLVDAEVQKLDGQDYDEKKEAQFGNAANVWGVNQTEQDANFRSGALQLVEGRHLEPGDVHKAVIHEDLAKANGLSIGSKLTLRGNPYDVDNQKQSTAEVQTEVVGLVSGSNAKKAAQRSELFSNTVFTDLDTTRELYEMTPDTEIYQDATFFVAKSADFDQVVKRAVALDIDWRNYQLSRSTEYLSGITGAIDGVRGVMGATTLATFVIAVLILTLVLLLWLNERKKETGVLLSLGTSKLNIVAQYLTELVMTAIPSFLLGCLAAMAFAQGLGNAVLGSVNQSALQELAKTGQAGADMGSSMASKTLESLSVGLSASSMGAVALITLGVIVLCVAIASVPMLRKPPRALLVDVK